MKKNYKNILTKVIALVLVFMLAFGDVATLAGNSPFNVKASYESKSAAYSTQTKTYSSYLKNLNKSSSDSSSSESGSSSSDSDVSSSDSNDSSEVVVPDNDADTGNGTDANNGTDTDNTSDNSGNTSAEPAEDDNGESPSTDTGDQSEQTSDDSTSQNDNEPTSDNNDQDESSTDNDSEDNNDTDTNEDTDNNEDEEVNEDTEENTAEEEAEEETESEQTSEEPKPDDSPTVYTGWVSGMLVTAVAEYGAFDEDVDMELTAIYSSEMLNMIADGVDGNVRRMTAVDITFVTENGRAVEPRAPIHVTFVSDKISEDAKVIHMDYRGNIEEMEADVNNGKAQFESDSFSIYAIVETGDTARVHVKFMNGTVEAASAYVKQGDDMAQVIYEPDLGTLPAGVIFNGWTTDPNYTGTTSGMTIAQVRDEVGDMLPPETDGTEVVYYAVLVKQYKITYLDDNNASLGQSIVSFRADSTETQWSYTVNMPYTPPDNTHALEGWLVSSGGSNIVDYVEGTNYPNGTEIFVTGDVVFSVNAPEGHWLVFDENGKGATYCAPRFIKTDMVTERPRPDSEMVRFGYTFGGWYDTKAHADAHAANTSVTTGLFTFGNTLSDLTTIYASWIPNAAANYTVLIWKQNLDGTGYDFEESIRLSGSVGATVNTVSPQSSGNNRYARINGTNYQYTGFHLGSFDENVTISTEGNSVVNVYYDRNQYTLTFQVEGYEYTPTTGNNGTQYGLVNGEYVELTRHSTGSWWNPNYYWTYGNNTRYNDTRYTRSSGWQTIKEITGLYEAFILLEFPIVGSNGITYNQGERWQPVGNTSVGNGNNSEVIVSLNTMPAESITFHLNEANRPLKTMYYYAEALPGETVDKMFDGIGFTLINTISARYNFVRRSGDFTDIGGMEQYKSDPEFGSNGRALESNRDESIDFYYLRKNYDINFMDGVYVDGNNNPQDETGHGQWKVEATIPYGSDISSYASYKPTAPAGYAFEGWYLDDACTQPYTFGTMPEGGVTVYAKWRLIQYRVFLHPNA